MNEYKIMVVDDEPDILDLLGKSLNMEGFPAVIKVDTGIKAVNTCKEIQPDIIIFRCYACRILTAMRYVNRSGSSPTAPFCSFPPKMMN